jgi:hypothetical protein
VIERLKCWAILRLGFGWLLFLDVCLSLFTLGPYSWHDNDCPIRQGSKTTITDITMALHLRDKLTKENVSMLQAARVD